MNLTDKLADVLIDRGTGWVKLHRVSPEAADLIERMLLAHGAALMRAEDCVNATPPHRH